MEGVGWIMSKEHELYVKKVKRDKLKVTFFRLVILLYIAMGISSRYEVG